MMRTVEEANKLATKNLGLAFSFRTPCSRMLDHDDHLSVCFVGLVKAARSFDESLGVAFTTFAYRCMKAEVMNEAKKVRLRQERGIDAAIPTGFRSELIVVDPRRSERDIADSKIDAAEKVSFAMASLDERKRNIIQWHVNDGIIFQEIGRRLGISMQRARQLFVKAQQECRFAIARHESMKKAA